MGSLHNFPAQPSSPQHKSFYDDMIKTGGGGNDGGGDMLEPRVAKLESDVEYIKISLAETRSDVKQLTQDASSIKTDISVVLQKLIDIDDKLSNKAGKDFVEAKLGNLKSWMLGILLLSIAMPLISMLVNLYIRKP